MQTLDLTHQLIRHMQAPTWLQPWEQALMHRLDIPSVVGVQHNLPLAQRVRQPIIWLAQHYQFQVLQL
jgi:hypothetical protein